MANLAKWSISSTNAFVTILTTELVTLANATLSAASSSVVNSSGLDIYADFELVVGATAAAFSAGAFATLYISPTADGTNFAESDRAELFPLVSFPLTTSTGNAQHRVYRANVVLPPSDFKLILDNQSGQAFSTGSGSNTVKILRYDVNLNG